MASYSFTTIWRLEAPIDRVYDAIEDSLAWPTWWPMVRAVEEVAPGDADGLGSVRRYVFSTRLPYTLSFDSVLTRRERPVALAGEARGELEGIGAWSLSESDGWTIVRYEWDIRTTRPWMNLLAPLPFVDGIFRLNHHAVMRDGLRGIRRLLGVRGEYARLA